MVVLKISGSVVSEISVGYAVTLRFGTRPARYELQVECPFYLADHWGVEMVRQKDYGNAESRLESLVGTVVVFAYADDSGELAMRFDNGATMSVPADRDFEAWGIAGPGGYRVISGPGGELAFWSRRP
ncbi:DUF6188 family protein [Nocardia asteroides]|uniref:DUF6188 family protein n=1 Tax=Nocardia asteroides TaxID=1824 RepID=UPI00364AD4F3